MTIGFIISTIVAVLAIVTAYYFEIKAIINANVTDAIDKAEKLNKAGEEKMQAAYEQIKNLVPTIFKPMFSEKTIKGIIQVAFDKIKDFASKEDKE